MRIEPTDATLGAFVTELHLNDLCETEVDAIRAAFLDYAVLVFPDQHLSDDEQIRFARHFGELSIESLPFTNEDGDRLRTADDPLMKLFQGNEGWHTDSSFQPVSAKASMLTARKVPSRGGQTEWADMRAAYEALDAEVRERIEDLTAFHSLYHSQGAVGADDETTEEGLATLHGQPKSRSPLGPGHRRENQAADNAPLRPLVKVHPETSRPALFIGRHAYGIPGLSTEESKGLLDELVTFAARPPRVYSHTWSVGDLVMWDNRAVLHRARPWPLDEARSMHHTRVNGEPTSETALNYR